MPNLHVQEVIVLFWIVVIATGCNRSNEQTNLPETVEINAKLEEVFEGNCYFEGPVWDPYTEKFYFTALRRNSQLLRLDAPGKASVILDRTQGIIGTFLLKSGKILCAQSGSHKILCVALHKDGSTEIEVMAQNFHWNQPNDVCRCPNGMIFFQILISRKRKRAQSTVFRKMAKSKKLLAIWTFPMVSSHRWMERPCISEIASTNAGFLII